TLLRPRSRALGDFAEAGDLLLSQGSSREALQSFPLGADTDLQSDPAVDGDRLARDVARVVADEERGQLTDVLGCLLAAERDATLHLIEEDVAGLEIRVLRNSHLHERREHFPRARPEKAR